MRRIVSTMLMALCLTSVMTQAKVKSEPKELIGIRMDGRADSIITDFHYVDAAEICQWQKSVTIEKDGRIYEFTPDNAEMFMRRRKHFHSRTLTLPDGTVAQLFLHRVVTGNDNRPSIYAYYLPHEGGEPVYYIQEKKDGPLTMIGENGSLEHPNAMQSYLLARNEAAGGDPDIAEYLCTLKPNLHAFDRSEMLISHQNRNLIPRFRYGVGAGINAESLELTFHDPELGKDFVTDLKYSVLPTLSMFADIPLGTGLSFHPELTFRYSTVEDVKVSGMSVLESMGTRRDAVINLKRVEIAVPMMGRYTFVKMRGNYLPYVDVGCTFDFYFSNTIKVDNEMKDKHGNISGHNLEKHEGGKVKLGVIGGLGLECKISQQHSLFFDVHFARNIGSIMTSYNDVKINHNCVMARMSVSL